MEFSSVASPHHQEHQSPHLLIEDDDDVILQVDDVMGHVTEAAIVLPSSSSRRLADLLQVRYIRFFRAAKLKSEVAKLVRYR